MSPIIEKLLLQIAYVCLHITAQGRWHAFYQLQGHTRELTVSVYPATTNYKEDGHPSAAAYRERLFYQAAPGWPYPHELEGEVPATLEKVLTSLDRFLDVEQLKAEPEAPSIQGIPPRMGGLDEVSVSAITALALAGGHAELLLTTRRQEVRVELTVDRFDVPTGYALECLLVAHGQRHSLKLSPGDGIYAARLGEWVESIATGTAAAA